MDEEEDQKSCFACEWTALNPKSIAQFRDCLGRYLKITVAKDGWMVGRLGCSFPKGAGDSIVRPRHKQRINVAPKSMGSTLVRRLAP